MIAAFHSLIAWLPSVSWVPGAVLDSRRTKTNRAQPHARC